jgi:hypothetical protein
MWKYKIIRVVPADKTVDFWYELSKDGVGVSKGNVVIDSSQLVSLPSDGREDYIKQVIAERCKPLMVISDVKADFSGLLGMEVELETVKYETKAERVAMQIETVREVL